MSKKIIGSVIIFLILATIVSVLTVFPEDRGIGRKVCSAKYRAIDTVYSLMVPYPDIEFSGNESEGFIVTSGRNGRVPVLTYHFVVPKADNPEPGNRSIINLETFEQHMAYLYEQGYYTASLSELEDFLHGNIELPERTVVITFDDGYENNYIYGYPILEKYGFQAAIFLIGGNVREESSEFFEPSQISFLSKAQLAEAESVFEYHSHTYALHYYINGRCGNMTSAVLDIELLEQDISKFKDMDIDSHYFAFPYGIYSAQAVHTLIDNGYRMAFTTEEGYVQRGAFPMLLPRFTMTSQSDLGSILDGG